MKSTNPLFPQLEKTVSVLKNQVISAARKDKLQELVNFIQNSVSKQQPIRINFICTHNSRRSHLSQIWAQTLAYYFNIKHVTCYSSGTEATAMFPMIAETLENAGFEINQLSAGNNPIYALKFAANEHPIIAFSKILDDDFNPKNEFAAVMTCDSANEACPIVFGAVKRIPITYEDPKAFDGTAQQKEKYQERSFQIAAEMFYVFDQINF